MIYALDTNAVIKLVTGHREIERHLKWAKRDEAGIAISTIVLSELWFGAMKSQRREDHTAGLKRLLEPRLTIWPFDSDDARAAGELRDELRRAGTPIGPYDLLIAAQARIRGATLVSANTREFGQVAGLALADWTAT